MTTIREVELQGHIIDSLTLTRVLDKIMDLDGEFDIITFNVGEHKSDPSYVRLAVMGRDEAHLDAIMTDLHRLGAQVPEIEDVRLGTADKDKVPQKGSTRLRITPRLFTSMGPGFPSRVSKWTA